MVTGSSKGRRKRPELEDQELQKVETVVLNQVARVDFYEKVII